MLYFNTTMIHQTHKTNTSLIHHLYFFIICNILSYNYLKYLNVILIQGFIFSSAFGQFKEISAPQVYSFDKYLHLGGTQSWDIEHYNHAISFIANNDGVLIYDQDGWSLRNTPQKTIIRSLWVDSLRKRLYVGAQGEFGYFNLTDGLQSYHDLIPTLPESIVEKLSDIWQIIPDNDHILLRTNRQIIRFGIDHESVNLIEPGGEITFLKKTNQGLLFHIKGKGIHRLTQVGYELFSSIPAINEDFIVDILVLPNDEHLLLTNSNGIYKYAKGKYQAWSTNCDPHLQQNLIQSGFYWAKKDLICIGTYLSGLMLFDSQGKLVKWIHKEDGLKSNTISCISVDQSQKLWLTSYRDICVIPLDQEPSYFSPDGKLEGAIYDIEEWNGQYFFATSTGLYRLPKSNYHNPLDKNPFIFISGSEGECWGLDIIHNELFVAHNKGAFHLNQQKELNPIFKEAGAWKFVSLNDSLIAVGTYNGIFIISHKEGEWLMKNKIPEFELSARIIKKDQPSRLWVTHPYKGIFKIEFNKDFTKTKITEIDAQDGIQNLNNCYGHLLNDQFIVSNDSSIYSYNEQKGIFQSDSKLNHEFTDERLIRIYKFDENYYYVSNKFIGRLFLNAVGTSTQLERDTLADHQNSFVGGFEQLYLDSSHIFICSEEGVIVQDLIQEAFPVHLQITGLQTDKGRRTLFSLEKDSAESINIDYGVKSFEIFYTALGAGLPISSIEYSSRLKGSGEDWTNWNNETKRSFQNLWSGMYTFELRARYNGKILPVVASETIRVESHYLLSNFALSIYVFVFFTGLFLAIFIPTQQQKKEKYQILKAKKKADSEVKNLKKENYQIQLDFKNKELASSTMHILQKNELINNVKDRISEIKSKVKDPAARKELRNLENRLKNDQIAEDDWEKFAIHFTKVHNDFFKKIKSQHSNLTPKDLKLCSYLKLNLTTKDIAPLLGISVRGVEVARYRLRKKLQLDSEENLNEYMMNL